MARAHEHDELHGRENQAFAWQRIDDLTVGPLLPANGPILRALALPALYGISNAAQVGTEVFLAHLESALQRGLRLVQLRERSLAGEELSSLAKRVVADAGATTTCASGRSRAPSKSGPADVSTATSHPSLRAAAAA